MPVYAATFSNRNRYQLQLHIAPQAYNLSGNFTDVAWSLRIVETTENGSYSYDAAPWSVTVHGQTWSGAASYDFRGTNEIIVGSGSKRVYHDGNGYATISFSGAVGGSTVIGSASAGGSLGLTRIPKPPGAPLISGTVGGTVLGPKNPTTTTMTVVFSGTTDGGSAITGWEIQYAENSAFTQNAKSVASGGTTTITGLKPGFTYYFRARGRNGVGWGAYSATASAKTLTALYVSDGTSWNSVEVYVSDGTTWHLAELYLSDGTTWKEPAA
ncbi:minor tail protein [Microbacterium phage Gretchen]|nr:minor tail protein [Microbacterium phage Gretchen]